jgi:hypothetical protein
MERLIICQPPRWYYHLSYNITPRTYLDARFGQKLHELSDKSPKIFKYIPHRKEKTPHHAIKRRTTGGTSRTET